MTSYREMYLHSTQHDHVGYHAHTDQLAFFKSFPPYRQQTILNLKAVNYGNESCTKKHNYCKVQLLDIYSLTCLSLPVVS